MKKLFAIVLVFAVLLLGCVEQNTQTTAPAATAAATMSPTPQPTVDNGGLDAAVSDLNAVDDGK